MARLIDANAFREFLEEIRQDYREEDTLSSGFAACLIETVQDEYLAIAPTVDAVEVVHGRWIMDKLEIGSPYDGNSTMLVDIGNCSVCGYRCEMLPTMNYCPNCGAKMDGERKDNGKIQRPNRDEI